MGAFRAGPNAVLRWIDSAGTVTLNTKYRSFEITYDGDTIDTSGGSDVVRSFIASLTQWGVTYEGIHQGTDSSMGTADAARLAPATSGTIVMMPFGTATGQFKHQGAAIITNRTMPYPYDDLAMIQVEWQGSGTLTETVN